MHLLTRMLAARLSQDSKALSEAMLDMFHTRTVPTHAFVPLFSELILEDWHTEHEDLASALQQLKDPRATDALYKATALKFDYLDQVDDMHAFQRKCTWALADIGNEAAKAYLQRIAQAEDQELSGYAQKRLDNWEREMGRKGSKGTEQ